MLDEKRPWLSDISKRGDFKEITAKGGRAKSEKKTKAVRETGSRKAKCKNCILHCDFKKLNLQKDPQCLCLVPKLRATAMENDTKVVSIDDNRIKMYMDEIMGIYQVYCVEAETNEIEPKKIERERMRRLNTMFKRLKEYKELWSPPVQKNLNVNVTTNFDRMKERFEKYKDELVVEVDGNE
jgi:hypothetical protein